MIWSVFHGLCELAWPGAENPTAPSLALGALLAGVVALSLALLSGPYAIAWLAGRFRQPRLHDSETLARWQAGKQATPSMGGLFLLGSSGLAIVAVGDLSQPMLWLVLFTLIAFGVIGAWDDWAKQRSGGRGLTARVKLAAQCVAALVVSAWLAKSGAMPCQLGGWLSNNTVAVRACLVVWSALVIVASSNAVNLADGLDGLAGGLVVVATLGLGALVCRTMNLAAIGSCEAEIISLAAIAGGTLGFLRFNRHPARVFMGDTGSLALGASLGLLALALGSELSWMVIGGVFVAEAVSVLLQVGYFRWRKQRLLRCAPLHHHFQFLGWAEPGIVARFWLAAVLCAALGLWTAPWLPSAAGNFTLSLSTFAARPVPAP